jgi:hypothetical protein
MFAILAALLLAQADAGVADAGTEAQNVQRPVAPACIVADPASVVWEVKKGSASCSARCSGYFRVPTARAEYVEAGLVLQPLLTCVCCPVQPKPKK